MRDLTPPVVGVFESSDDGLSVAVGGAGHVQCEPTRFAGDGVDPVIVRRLVSEVRYALAVVREAVDLVGSELDEAGVDLVGVVPDLTRALELVGVQS